MFHSFTQRLSKLMHILSLMVYILSLLMHILSLMVYILSLLIHILKSNGVYTKSCRVRVLSCAAGG